jgi:hypothetical protein
MYHSPSHSRVICRSLVVGRQLWRRISSTTQATIAQLEEERAQREMKLAQQMRSQEETVRELRAAIAQLEGELAAMLAAGDLDRLAVARALLEHGVSQRLTADLIGLKESTLRSRLKAATNGHRAAGEHVDA